MNKPVDASKIGNDSSFGAKALPHTHSELDVLLNL